MIATNTILQIDIAEEFTRPHSRASINLETHEANESRMLNGLTPYEYICKCWTNKPERFRLDPIHQMPGLNS
ncbi:hypothetical protein CDO26_35970 (plasmid) [Sinorhizobium meliloti]|nr:hypothetical protein CDO26_35970 [Sinorhizobium meliloti]